MTSHSAWTDGVLIAAYVLGPAVFYLFHGDKKPTIDPETARLRNT